MSNNADDWIVIGRFGRAHGVKGFITVHSFADPAAAIKDYLPWYIRQDNERLPLQISEVRVQDKLILAKIEHIDDRDKVSEYTNVDIEILRSALPKLMSGDYYWHELIGMQVINIADEPLGVVVDLLSTGTHDVLIVDGEKRHLIPYVLDKFITKIDGDKKIIIADWDKDF